MTKNGENGDKTTQVGIRAAEIDDIIKDVRQELRVRVEGKLSEKDRIAVTTALAKACIAGIDTGIKMLADDIAEHMGLEVKVSPMSQFVDPWAERYGG